MKTITLRCRSCGAILGAATLYYSDGKDIHEYNVNMEFVCNCILESDAVTDTYGNCSTCTDAGAARALEDYDFDTVDDLRDEIRYMRAALRKINRESEGY